MKQSICFLISVAAPSHLCGDLATAHAAKESITITCVCKTQVHIFFLNLLLLLSSVVADAFARGQLDGRLHEQSLTNQHYDR